MHLRSHVAVCAIALLGGSCALSASGCGDDSKPVEAAKPAEPAKQVEPAKAASARPVPSSLGEVESSAEDIIDFAMARQRSKVVRRARELRQAAAGQAAVDLRKAQVPEAAIALLQERGQLVSGIAPRAGFLRVSLAANQVSALMPELYAGYTDPVPPDVLRLDFLDREAELRSLAGDRASVRKASSQLSSTWVKLRPQVVKAGGREEAASYSRHAAALRRLAKGSNEQALRKEAVTGLELVDSLENVFLKK